MNLNLASMVAAMADQPSDKGIHFGADDDNFCSYPSLFQRIAASAKCLSDRGITPHRRVLVPMATTLDAITGLFALIWLGALPFSIKTPAARSDLDEYQNYIELLAVRYGASAILDTGGLDPFNLPVPRLSLDDVDTGVDTGHDTPPPFAPPSDAIAFVQFSSGTTGAPKGIPIGHEQLIRQLQLIVRHDGRTEQDIGASWLPLYHDMGLVGLLSSIYAGQDVYWDTPADFLMRPLDWLASLSERRVFVTALPNFGLNYLLRHLKKGDDDPLQGHSFDHLKHIYLGSDMIDPQTLTDFTQSLAPYGLPADALTPCYGMAEAVLMVTCKARGSVPAVSTQPNGQHFVSVGPVAPDFEVKIVAEDNEGCAAGEIGRILIRGGTLATCYFENDVPLRGDDGFYETGDLGYFANRQLYITGRAGERIKINGESYFLPHFEHILQTHPDLRPGGVAAIQAAGKLVLLVEPRRRGSAEQLRLLKRELLDLILTKCGIKLGVDDVLVVGRGQLKRTSSGKLQRGVITRAFLDGSLTVVNEEAISNIA